MSSPALQIITIILSAAASFASGMVLWHLKALMSRMDSQEQRIANVEAEQLRLAERKSECQRDFVTAEQWVRSERYTRDKLDAVAASMAELNGKLKVVEQLPVICGNIAREISKQLKGNGND